MKHAMMLSDEEIRELDGLVNADISERRTELRRTRNPKFRAQVQHHLELDRHILHELEKAGDTQKQM